jgi:hypothetical protein
MKLFQADLNRSLCNIAERAVEVGRELMGKHDAGSRIKLLAHIDELNFMCEAYKNLCFYSQVNIVTQKFGPHKYSRNDRGSPGAPSNSAVAQARKTSEACLVHTVKKLLQYLRDEHNLPVGELLDEVFSVTTPVATTGVYRNQRRFKKPPVRKQFDANFRQVEIL